MITFEFFQLFYRRKWRWLTVICVEFFLSILVAQVNGQKLISITVWDFIVDGLAQPFISMVIVPSLFLFLIVDLFVNDFEDGYVGYTVYRSKSRISWLIAKISTLFAGAFTFTLIIVLVYFITAILFGMAFDHRFSGHSIMYENFSPNYVLTMLMSLFVFTLTALGTFIIIITLYTRNSVVPWILGTILCVLSYVTYIRYAFRIAFVWMPTTQMFLLVRLPNKFIENIEVYTFQWSYIYNISFFIISVLLGVLRIRIMDLSKSE